LLTNGTEVARELRQTWRVSVAIYEIARLSMDSHVFSDPLPVQGADIPTWEVEVVRSKGDVVVGRLEVNRDVLPPRKGKKQTVVWKLPDDPTHTPRFGEHEKKRLWELFKEQKKLRRRQSKQQQQQQPPGESEFPSQTGNCRSSDNEDFDSEIVQLEGPSPSSQSSHGPEKSKAEISGSNTKRSPSRCTNIPPLREKEESPEYRQHDQNSLAHPNVDTVSADEPKSKTSPLLPPPPGFLAPVENGSSAPLNILSAQTLPAFTPPVVDPTLLVAAYGPPLFFSYPLETTTSDGVASSSLGRTVVETFIAAIGRSSSVDSWVAHYQPNAVKTLLMGTAQVTVSTSSERREQWETMVRGDGSGAWNVTGWTSHDPGYYNNLPNVSIVVLTGTTRQATGLFSFSLSLVLAAAPDDGSEITTSEPTQRRYSITNDVLTLFEKGA
jgi:hypothetical protein